MSQRRPLQLMLALDGFEGPIDLLLTMARDQKVDLSKIAILPLAEQYLSFVEQARRQRLELAADYLVMAAWLAYLKSRLLLPPEPAAENGAEPSAEQLAEALAFQLRRLDAMRKAAAKLIARPRLGAGVYGRGQPEGIALTVKPIWYMSLYELLDAYGAVRRRADDSIYKPRPLDLDTVEAALERLETMLGRMPGAWAGLTAFLPPPSKDPLMNRSTLACTLLATLELAKQGRLEIRQAAPFQPLELRRARDLLPESVA